MNTGLKELVMVFENIYLAIRYLQSVFYLCSHKDAMLYCNMFLPWAVKRPRNVRRHRRWAGRLVAGVA